LIKVGPAAAARATRAERALLRRGQDVQHLLGRTAQPRAQGGHDDGAVDEDRVLQHRVDQLRIGDARRMEVQLGEKRLFGSHGVEHRLPRGGHQGQERGAVGRGFQVFDDFGLHAAVADQGQRVAGRTAFRVVIDGDGGHGRRCGHWGASGTDALSVPLAGGIDPEEPGCAAR
jgi:hypothetical protein